MTAFLIVWFIVGITLAPFSYAMLFAYVQRKYPRIAKESYREDMGFAMLFSLFTLVFPIIFIIAFFSSGFAEYGLKWK